MRAAALVGVAAAAFVLGPLLVRQAARAHAEAEISADAGDGSTPLDAIDIWGAIERQAEQHRTEQAVHDTNVSAFLAMIDFAEGTSRGGRDPYRTCFGYRHTIASFADHPAVTGEWRGEKLPDSMCRAANLPSGCVSTAAGRYQLIKGTWLRAKRALELPDFGPASQDAAAVWLIDLRGALPDVRAGRVEQAIAKCRREWASLPGAGWQQAERRLEDLLVAYGNAGGALA